MPSALRRSISSYFKKIFDFYDSQMLFIYFFKENRLITLREKRRGERERTHQCKYKEKLIPDTVVLTLPPIYCAILFLKLKRKIEH